MKTKKEFLENCQHRELAEAVLDQTGMVWKDLIQYPEDYRDAGAGVSGFIYYSDTCKFAKDNLLLIINALNEFEHETGAPLDKPTDDETQYLNWLSWFALENTIDQIMQYKDN